MKKGLLLLLLILFSCQKDEIIIEPVPTQELIFNLSDVLVQDGQNISFEVLTSEPHEVIISKDDGSVLTKESFQSEIGINTRRIFTRILPKEKLKLSLEKNGEVIQETFIIIE